MNILSKECTSGHTKRLENRHEKQSAVFQSAEFHGVHLCRSLLVHMLSLLLRRDE